MSSYIDEDVKNYIEKKSNFQNKILEFIDENGEDESKIDIYKYFDELKSQNYAFDVKKILILLKTIIDYHHRGNNFYAQMEKIFIYFKEDIKQAFNNTELFDLFSESKLALLILLENEMIQIDESIAKTLTKSEQDRDYFLYQLLQFYSNHPLTTINPEHVEKTKLGVNEDYLPTLIRTDLVDDFITHVNGKNISLNSYISISIYETNRLLIEEYVQPTLIEYATFYGSIKIFQYLKTNNVKLTPSLWIYAIHSNNAELIHILEENNIEPEDKTYETCFIEAVKCHHNDIANYFLNTKKFKHFYLGTYWENENYDLIPIDQDSYTQWIFSLGGLYYSIQENPELYDLLFKASYIDVNRINNNETLLLIAMTNNNKKVIKLLASNPKCDTNIKFKMNGKEYTALTYAVENNQIDVVQLLFENQNIDPNIKLEISYGNEKTALSTAIQNNQIKIIELLVSNSKCDTNIKFKMNGKEYTALTYSVENNQIDVVQILLVNQNTDPNIVFKKDGKDYTLLSMAIEINKIDLIQSILSNENTDPNFILEVDGKSFTALSLTIEKDNFELFKTLVSHPKTDPNIILKTGYYTENTAAKMIIEKNNKEMIELLLSNQNFNPNTKFNAGDYIKCEKTVLSMVFEANNSELMEQLFTRKDLDPNVKFVEDKMNKTFSFESEEKTILSMAIENDNIEIVRQILSLPNIDINLKLSRKNKDTQTTIKENTVLQLALTKGNREIINLLLNNEKINLKII